MTVAELIEELIKLPQDSNENLEVFIDNGISCHKADYIRRGSVFDKDGSNQRTVAFVVSRREK